MTRYICIHGHFYQPPRENPWLEAIELQDPAYPYHDWNERISAECYAPNTAARILNEKGWIKKIFNNYDRISFNFGPTLLDWMKSTEPDTYRAIIEADRESQKRFSGHGSAMAQVYNHMIMPLANRRDKYTQIIWGLRDFEKRFGRKPEGMWLPETAVDIESLEIMAEHGISFTILAQYQARRYREIGSGHWHEAGPLGIDPTMPYQLLLPESGRKINIFFYDGPISQAVAFEKLLNNGERFAQRLMNGFSDGLSRPQLVNIATDGETYGHHHRYAEMALAYALDYIESNNLAQITNYGEFLDMYPPTHEVEIIKNTAWSCAHGVARWEDDCGCSTGLEPCWTQAWRAPLREALNWLRDSVISNYEEYGRLHLKDPWAARNDYIKVILERSPENIDRFLADHCVHEPDAGEQITVLKLLEMQRHAMLMFTSCGWFFDDISVIGTVQILQYAGRVIQLARELFNSKLEPRFLEILARAKSNKPEYRDGAHIYKKYVTPAMVDLPKVGAHYAISSLFEKYCNKTSIFCYTLEQLDKHSLVAGETKLTVGQARITSQITLETAIISFGVLFINYQNIKGGARVFRGEDSYRQMVGAVTGAFNRADLFNVVNLLDEHFKEDLIYSLKQLFRDSQRKIMELILESTMAELETDYQKIYKRYDSIMRFLKDLGYPMPRALKCAADFHLNTNLLRSFSSGTLNLERISMLLNEAKTMEINLDDNVLKYVFKANIEWVAGQLSAKPADLTLLEELDAMTGLVCSLPFEVNLWKVQNIYYKLLQTVYPEQKKKAGAGEQCSRTWLDYFVALGEKLKVQRGIQL